MSVAGCTGRRRQRWVFAGFVVASAVMAAPAAASACPSFAKEKVFQGTASASFKQTASFSDQSGTTTVTLDRVADGLQYHKLVAQSLGNGIVVFKGPPEGGSVSVNDVYYGSNGDSGGQTANGATLGYPGAANAGISFYPAQFGCRYGVIFSFAIHTSPSGDWPSPPDLGVFGLIATPERPIPASLKLSGTATVAWNADPNAGKGFYDATGGPPRTDTWAMEYGGLLQESGMARGRATISWSFSPVKAACVVPKLKGKTLAQAKSLLQAAGCRLGKVTSMTSFTVPKGRVISSNPTAGKKLPADSKVDLVISGPPCVVPNVIGAFLYQAKPALTGANCTAGKLTYKYSFTVDKGKVISSHPNAGTKLAYGAAVALTVSKGTPKCVIPKFVVGKPLPQAKAILGASYCLVGNVTYQTSTTFAKNRVITTKPKPGSKLTAYSKVDLVVSNGP